MDFMHFFHPLSTFFLANDSKIPEATFSLRACCLHKQSFKPSPCFLILIVVQEMGNIPQKCVFLIVHVLLLFQLCRFLMLWKFVLDDAKAAARCQHCRLSDDHVGFLQHATFNRIEKGLLMQGIAFRIYLCLLVSLYKIIIYYL